MVHLPWRQGWQIVADFFRIIGSLFLVAWLPSILCGQENPGLSQATRSAFPLPEIPPAPGVAATPHNPGEPTTRLEESGSGNVQLFPDLPNPLPNIHLDAPENTGSAPSLPGGVEVSRPQDSNPLEILVEEASTSRRQRRYRLRNSADGYFSADLLFWWTRPIDLPPLLLGSRSGEGTPTLAGKGMVLLGGEQTRTRHNLGSQFAFGFYGNNLNLHVRHFAMSPRYLEFFVDSFQAGIPNLARPVIDATTGQEIPYLIAEEGTSRGSFLATYSTRFSSWDVTLGKQLNQQPQSQPSELMRRFSLEMLAGYRFFGLLDNIELSHRTYALRAGLPTLLHAYDFAETDNQFHGAQFGLSTGYSGPRIMLHLDAKLGIGGTFQRHTGGGATRFFVNSPTAPTEVLYSGGVLEQAIFPFELTQGRFSVLPEGRVTMGVRLTQNTLLTVGYHFLYLDDVVRAWDQFSRVYVIPGQAGNVTWQAISTIERNTHFWAHSLALGFLFRF